MIAKHGIMPDLERSDARLGATFRLKRGNGAPPIPRHSPEIVECCVIAISDIAALCRFRRRTGHQGATQQVDKRPVAIQQGQQLRHQRRHIWKPAHPLAEQARRSEEHTSELQSLMRISYAVFCLKKKKKHILNTQTTSTP